MLIRTRSSAREHNLTCACCEQHCRCTISVVMACAGGGWGLGVLQPPDVRRTALACLPACLIALLLCPLAGPAGAGFNRTDQVYYITGLSSGSCSDNIIAYTIICHMEPYTYRPNVAAINLCPKFWNMAEPSPSKQVAALVHEMIHGLVSGWSVVLSAGGTVLCQRHCFVQRHTRHTLLQQAWQQHACEHCGGSVLCSQTQRSSEICVECCNCACRGSEQLAQQAACTISQSQRAAAGTALMNACVPPVCKPHRVAPPLSLVLHPSYAVQYTVRTLCQLSAVCLPMCRSFASCLQGFSDRMYPFLYDSATGIQYDEVVREHQLSAAPVISFPRLPLPNIVPNIAGALARLPGTAAFASVDSSSSSSSSSHSNSMSDAEDVAAVSSSNAEKSSPYNAAAEAAAFLAAAQRKVLFLVTPKLAAFAREYYSCPALPGAPADAVSEGSHWRQANINVSGGAGECRRIATM